MRRALVTGGASPIGVAICRALAGAEYHVTVHANGNAAGAAALAESLRAAGHGADTLVCDLTDAAETAERLRSVLEAGPIEALVHNAGLHDDAPMAGMAAAQWHRVVDVSLNGFFAVTQPLLLPMIGRRRGRIVAISSVSALLGNRGQANYAAAKAGLIGAAKSLAREVASRGITVNAVAPGLIESPAAEAFDPVRLKQIVPMNRAGTPGEVAALVRFLCSDEAGYITGQCISINGGMV